MASDPLLSDARAIVEHVDPTDGFDAGLCVSFFADHGPALLARLEGCEALRAQYEAAIRVLRERRYDAAGSCAECCSDTSRHYSGCTIAAVLSHPLAKEVTP